MKVGKNKPNDFGHYKYRSATDIYEAAKPLLVKYKAKLLVDEEIKEVIGRPMSVVTATYMDEEEEIKVHGYAELAMHKGMSPEQCMGTASSYAAKYALLKLFLLDDSTDADSLDNDNGNSRPLPRRQPRPRQTPQQKALHDQATAKMEAMQAAKQEAANTVVDSTGTTLLQLFAEAMQTGKGSPKSQELDAWAHQSEENMALVQRIAATGAWK
ncbi:ERF family protein [Lactobacillus delbrueckii subsp. allosunkii]